MNNTKTSRKNVSLASLELSQTNTLKLDELPSVLTSKNFKFSDLSEMARQQQISQIVDDDQNKFNFYDIQQYEKQRLKKKNGTNFQSLNIVSDTQLVRGAKFFKKRIFDSSLMQLRNSIKNEPGKLQLLSEIYVQLEQNFEALPVISKHSKDQELESKKLKERVQLEMLELDIFSKKVKEERELQKKLQEEEERKLEEERQKKLQKGASRKLSLSHLVKSQTQKLLSQTNNISNNNNNANTNNNNNNKDRDTPDTTNAIKQQKHEKSSTLSKMLSKKNLSQEEKEIQQKSKEAEIVEEKDKQNFVQDFNKALQGILQKDFGNQKQQHSKHLDQDRNVRQKIVNYMKGGVDIDADEKNENSDYDYTPEGVRMTIQAFYLNQIVLTFNSVVEKSKFYEKKSNQFDNKIQNKIQNCEAVMMNKMHTERILRLENHTIIQKIRDLKKLLQTLEGEYKILKNKSASGEQQAPKKGLTKFLKKSGDQQQLMQQQQQEPVASQTTPKQELKEQRSNLIEDLMKKTQREHELEDEIRQLKDSHKKYEQKMIFNNQIVSKMEQEVHAKKVELKILKEAQLVFYQEILNRGKDCRDEGLSWIIRKIYSLGEKVYDMYLPNFLDQRAREFLMQKAQKKMEFEELRNIIESQLDIYKINVNIRKEEEKAYLRQLEYSKQHQDNESSDEESEVESPTNNYSKTNINFDKSMMTVQGSIQNYGNNSLPSIKSPNSSIIMNNTLSQIDVNKIRYEDLLLKKSLDQEQQISKLIDSMEPQTQQIAEKTLDELNKTKLTSNDIIYDQTKKKINVTLKSWTKTKITDPNSKQESVQEEKQNDAYVSVPLPYRIILFENNQQLNKYTNREEFIKEYSQMQNKIDEKKKTLSQMEELEVQRIIKEFDFKQYATRYKIDCPTVLGALFGCYQADRLIIRFGMMHK